MAERNVVIPVTEYGIVQRSYWFLDLRRYTPALQKGDTVIYSAAGGVSRTFCQVLIVASASTYPAVFKTSQGVALMRVLQVREN